MYALETVYLEVFNTFWIRQWRCLILSSDELLTECNGITIRMIIFVHFLTLVHVTTFSV